MHSVSPQPSEAPVSAAIREISIAHSPDSDDAFMFYGLATNKVRVPGYRFTHTLCDIETLNRRAQDEAFFDVTAISFHAYPYVQNNYTLMGCGGSVGEGYGPMVVSSRRLTPDDLKQHSHRRSRHAHHRLPGAQDLQPRPRRPRRFPSTRSFPPSWRANTMPASSFTRVSSPIPPAASTG